MAEALKELRALDFLNEVQMSGGRRIWGIASQTALQQWDPHCLHPLSIQACPRTLKSLFCCTLEQRQPGGLSCILEAEGCCQLCPGASSSWIADSHQKINQFSFQPASVTVTGSFFSLLMSLGSENLVITISSLATPKLLF